MSLGLDHDHPRDVRLEDPRDLPGIPRDLKRHAIIADQALSEQLQILRRAGHPARPAAALLIEDRDLTEIAVHV